MSLVPALDCTFVDARSGEVLRAATLPVVPRVGESVRLGDGGGEPAAGVYRVASVRYEVEGRQRLRLGHLAGITVGLEPAG